MSTITTPNEKSVEGMVGTDDGNQRVVMTTTFNGTQLTHSTESVEVMCEDGQGNKQRCVAVTHFSDSESSPIPSQVGNAGTFLKTNGTSLEWDEVLQNTATGTMSTTIDGYASSAIGSVNIGTASEANGANSVSIGITAANDGTDCTCVGAMSKSTSGVKSATCIGSGTTVSADGGIAIGYGASNSEANSMVVALNQTNIKLLDSNGNIPAIRFANLPQNNGNYKLRLTISGGVPTLSWVSE